jgi:hypothetical protein
VERRHLASFPCFSGAGGGLVLNIEVTKGRGMRSLSVWIDVTTTFDTRVLCMWEADCCLGDEEDSAWRKLVGGMICRKQYLAVYLYSFVFIYILPVQIRMSNSQSTISTSDGSDMHVSQPYKLVYTSGLVCSVFQLLSRANSRACVLLCWRVSGDRVAIDIIGEVGRTKQIRVALEILWANHEDGMIREVDSGTCPSCRGWVARP